MVHGADVRVRIPQPIAPVRLIAQRDARAYSVRPKHRWTGIAVRFNVFAGARRIAILVAAIDAIATIAIAASNVPYASAIYVVEHPTAPFTR